jgi:hypothetical protein
MLTPVIKSEEDTPTRSSPPVYYGMGWFVREEKKGLMEGDNYPFFFGHTGGAVGVSSVLTIMPAEDSKEQPRNLDGEGPQGVAVAVILNLEDVKGVSKLGSRIAREFRNL